MKNILRLLLLLITGATHAQIFTQSNTNGSITITPKGLQGIVNPSLDTSNVYVGPSALRSIMRGTYNNTAMGNSALRLNTTGNNNTATGSQSLYSNTTGESNTANGVSTLYKNSDGYNNTAIGFQSLYSNTTGINNTATGFQSLYNNMTGESNTANGANALYNNTTGDNNTANGYQSLFNNKLGTKNTAYGVSTLYSSTFGTGNTATGVEALYSNTTGDANTANGYDALKFNTTGIHNTACGTGALILNETGNYNAAYGSGAGLSSRGTFNTFIGSYADIKTPNFNLTNATALGSTAKVDASNKVRIGNEQVTVIEGQVAWSYPSDRRLKENIQYTSRLGLDFITKLQTVSYNYISDKTHVRHDGFIAQDIESIMKELKIEFSGLKKSEDGTYSLAYSDFVMPLVNAAKELKQQNEEHRAKIEKLEKKLSRMEELEKRLNVLEASLTTAPTGK